MKNVIFDNGEEIGDVYKNNYTFSIIKHLSEILPQFEDYLFIVFNHNKNQFPTSRLFKHPMKILFWEGGENKRQQADVVKNDYLFIFSHYTWDRDNIVSIPLGFFNDYDQIVPMKERLFQTSFIGCLNRNRIKLASEVSGFSERIISIGNFFNKSTMLSLINYNSQRRNPNSYFGFNEDFNKGLDGETFSWILSHSRIAFCPKGWVNTETFRLYEAMRLGCVVISEYLPDRSYYEDIPIFQIKDWKSGVELAKDISEDVSLLEQVGNANREFYESTFNPKIVARKISSEISNKQTRI